MFCAISGEAPEVPVLSKVSGNVFEKRLLESYVATNHKDPVNAQEMTEDDIVDIKTSRIIKPRPPTATSIPSLLSIFQNEWDALALETFQVRQQLYQTRQELSTALYQHDAACRVIARVMKERDEAREALARVSENMNGSTAEGDKMLEDDVAQSLPSEVQDTVNGTLERLSAGRKKRKVPEGWTTPESIGTFKGKRATKEDAVVLQLPSQASRYSFFAQHPSGDFYAATSGPDSWTLNSVHDDHIIAEYKNDSEITCLEFHPDGHLLALGAKDGNVYIFHLLTCKVEAVFGPAAGAISSLAFSENGFWLAVVSDQEPIVKIWHLAKGTIVSELEVKNKTKYVTWDYSGQFLATVGPEGYKILVYTKAGKTWSTALEGKGVYNRAAWQPEAKSLVLEGEKTNMILS